MHTSCTSDTRAILTSAKLRKLGLRNTANCTVNSAAPVLPSVARYVDLLMHLGLLCPVVWVPYGSTRERLASSIHACGRASCDQAPHHTVHHNFPCLPLSTHACSHQQVRVYHTRGACPARTRVPLFGQDSRCKAICPPQRCSQVPKIWTAPA